jgi:hypothetical protein
MAPCGLVDFKNVPEEPDTFFFRIELKTVAAGSPETYGICLKNYTVSYPK